MFWEDLEWLMDEFSVNWCNEKMVTAVPGCECLRLLKCGAWLSRTKMGFLGDVLSNFFVYIMWEKKKFRNSYRAVFLFPVSRPDLWVWIKAAFPVFRWSLEHHYQFRVTYNMTGFKVARTLLFYSLWAAKAFTTGLSCARTICWLQHIPHAL